MKDLSHNVPFQVETIINGLMDKNERPHVRENYRARLKAIRDIIDASISKYDSEANMNFNNVRKKRA